MCARLLHPRVYILLGLLLWWASSADARVFRLLPRWHGGASAGQPGWNLAYRASLEINGGPGDLEVLGSGFDARETLRLLERNYRALGARVMVAGGDLLGWGLAAREGYVTRFLVVPSGRTAECVVYRLTQTVEEFRQSLAPPDRHRVGEIPVLPGSRPQWSLRNETASSAVELSTATGWTPAAAVSRLAAALASEGWTTPVPLAEDGNAPLARLYVRGRDLAVIQATPGPEGIHVIRLYKRLKE